MTFTKNGREILEELLKLKPEKGYTKDDRENDLTESMKHGEPG